MNYITYVAPEWPMCCRGCDTDMGYWIPGLPPEEHFCQPCEVKRMVAEIMRVAWSKLSEVR